METRIAQKNDKELVKNLWENSFNYSKNFIDWYFEKAYVPENTFITSNDGEAISSLSIIPQKIKVAGFETDAAYISGLAIPPEYRDEETLKKQLSDSIAVVDQKDCLLSIVIPSNYKFYERYGWRTAYSYKQYDIKPGDLPAYQIKGRILRATLNDGTINSLSDIYNEFMADKNAYAVRSDYDWKLILEDLFGNFGGRCIIFHDSQNKPAGYLLCIIRDRKMCVYEFAYKNRAAYESLMGFIRSHELNVDSVAIKAAADDLSYLDFCDNRMAVHFCPFAMARISNAKRALKIASVNCFEKFNFQIIDRLIESNNKTFMVCNGEAFETEEPADVITDIGTLTQMFMGYIGVEDAKRMNLISGNDEVLKMLFEKKNNYINMLLI